MLILSTLFNCRVGIGTHSVPDVEVASEDYEAMNLQLFVVKERPKIARPCSPTGKVYFKQLRSELLLV